MLERTASHNKKLAHVAVGLLSATTLAGCSSDDAEILSGSTNEQPTSTSVESTSTVKPGSTTTAAQSSRESTTTRGAPAGDQVPDSASMKLMFTYSAAGSRVRNPYVAAWVETQDGNLVAPVFAWYLQEPKGQRWLNELREWYAAGGASFSANVTDATRIPGAYEVTWDVSYADGTKVPSGEYVLVIEAAREHGPYSLIQSTFTIGNEGQAMTFEANGEITAASAEYSV